MKEEKPTTWGEWAFFAGLVVAIVLGISPAGATAPWVGPTMAVLGLLIGFLNISAQETTKFLVAAVTLLVVGSAGVQSLPWVGSYMDAILWNISQFVAPAALIVALKAVLEMARGK
jgi:hypothetical protein